MGEIFKNNVTPDLPGGSGEIVSKVTSYLLGASIVIAFIVLIIVGIKFMVGSTQERAEYKKSLIPIVVGVFLVVFAMTIVKILFGMNPDGN